MNSLTFLVPLLPFSTFLVNFLFFRKNKHVAPAVSILGVLAAFGLSCVLALQTLHDPAPRVDQWTWLSVTTESGRALTIKAGAMLDPLCAMMLVVVTLVSSLVHIYSLGYMHEDEGMARFFMYLGLFTFSMLGLIISPNLFQIYMFWELVGLCSYLLIGFWYFKPEAANAAKKAFVVNRVGDFGFFLGILFLTYYLGTSDFRELPAKVAQWPLLGPASLPLGLVALLLFCGAVGKSAQFPLHVWLPDAMEGPTPVSALIHAATMVAAGVYLIARAYFVFDAAALSSVHAAQVVAYVGGFTSIFAATIACTQFDIKRVLAYSTLSQLGYMVMALGCGGLGTTAGPFHLFTHAFFKALLFLGSGSVIHAMHTNDVRQMGGLMKKMPITAITFLVGCLAIAGVPPLAGFWSKDEILLAAQASGHMDLFYLAAGVAFLTAFYMFRIFILTFRGAEPAHGHPHESPVSMTLPLVVLALLSCVVGFAGMPGLSKGFGHYIHYERPAGMAETWNQAAKLAAENPGVRGTAAAVTLAESKNLDALMQVTEPAPAEAAESESINWGLAAKATSVGLLGIFLAWLVYSAKIIRAESLARAFGPLYTLAYNKYYIDEIYRWFVDNVYFALSAVIAWFDRHVVDGLMNGLAWVSQAGGGIAKKAQTGQVQTYAFIFFLGVAALLGLAFAFPPLMNLLQTGGH